MEGLQYDSLWQATAHFVIRHSYCNFLHFVSLMENYRFCETVNSLNPTWDSGTGSRRELTESTSRLLCNKYNYRMFNKPSNNCRFHELKELKYAYFKNFDLLTLWLCFCFRLHNFRNFNGLHSSMKRYSRCHNQINLATKI